MPQIAAVVAFVALVVIALYWVKWHPYYHKGFTAASKVLAFVGASVVAGLVTAGLAAAFGL